MTPQDIIEHLNLPPERVRLAEIYPDLPYPIPFASAEAEGPADEDEAPDLRGLYYAAFEERPLSWASGYVVPQEHHRVIEEYAAARERQAEAAELCAAARWLARERAPAEAAPLREPEPEAIPPAGKLTPRQEEFCRHYAAQPVATRAAVLAEYSEEHADTYGPRLLKNPLVLDRIAAMRAARNIQYVVERDTLHDKLEAVFFGALAERNHSAAVAALRLQAALGGLSLRPGGSTAPGASAGEQAAPAHAKSGKVGVKRRKKSGKVGKSR